VTATGLDRQFARTPYAVSFEAGAEELTLVTLHVIWGDDEQKRAEELREIATWLADWPNRESTWRASQSPDRPGDRLGPPVESARERVSKWTSLVSARICRERLSNSTFCSSSSLTIFQCWSAIT
jgi:hypothetical protein